MKKKGVFIKLFTGFLIASMPLALQAQDRKPPPIESKKLKPVQSARTEKSPYRKIHYIPPSLDKKAPKRRVESGGTRNVAYSTPLKVTLLSPSHVAQTISAKPTLYWHLSRDSELPAIFTIIEVNAVKPLVETQIQESAVKGFHTIYLKDYEIELQINKTYEWSISLIKDRQNQYPSSGDIVEKTFLERISENSLVNNTKTLAQKNTLERARIYAENGIWYESLEMVMGKDPNTMKNQEILDSRLELLNQVGITNLK